MKTQIVTTAIILTRIDYGEADRIITVLTPEHGKLSMMARGVRRHKSKLAGGIELFSTSDITYMPGKGDLGTLVSSRLVKYYDKIVTDIEHVQLGYELIKLLNKTIEDNCEAVYYELLTATYEALNDPDINPELIRNWFHAQLLRIAGHTPNLRTDISGNALTLEQTYNFDSDGMTFIVHERGRFTPTHIKGLRLLFDGHPVRSLHNVTGLEDSINDVTPLMRTMLADHLGAGQY